LNPKYFLEFTRNNYIIVPYVALTLSHDIIVPYVALTVSHDAYKVVAMYRLCYTLRRSMPQNCQITRWLIYKITPGDEWSLTANRLKAVSERQRGKIQLKLNCAVGYGVHCVKTNRHQSA
jgi:hypothetical protein